MKLTINIRQDLAEAKQAYRDHFSSGKKQKVTKKQIQDFCSALVEADLEAITIVDDYDNSL